MRGEVRAHHRLAKVAVEVREELGRVGRLMRQDVELVVDAKRARRLLSLAVAAALSVAAAVAAVGTLRVVAVERWPLPCLRGEAAHLHLLLRVVLPRLLLVLTLGRRQGDCGGLGLGQGLGAPQPRGEAQRQRERAELVRVDRGKLDAALDVPARRTLAGGSMRLRPMVEVLHTLQKLQVAPHPRIHAPARRALAATALLAALAGRVHAGVADLVDHLVELLERVRAGLAVHPVLLVLEAVSERGAYAGEGRAWEGASS
eukprot:scaffold107018_cov45-Phaeocystis_antarctica.AAC.1